MEKFQQKCAMKSKAGNETKFQKIPSRVCENKLKNFSGQNVFNCNLWALSCNSERFTTMNEPNQQ